ncbi:MAG: flagellin [Gammaproteobacteria bacterium]|nr:flagellin [Gammaproteobacteria bacterium]
MPQIINTNISSLTAQRNLNRSQSSLQTTLQRLSSGLRINSAKDDAAGLAISERFTTQIRGLNQAVRNANDGISFAQTAESALSTVSDSLQRIRELAIQSANDTNSATDRQALNNEAQQLIAEVNRVANATQFNGNNILDGSLSNLVFQVGANQNQTISVDGVDSRTSQLGARVSQSGSIDATALAAAITADNLVVQGSSVDLSAATTINEVVTAINAVFGNSGVQATKATSVTTEALTYTADAAARTITLNGVQVSIGAAATRDATVTALNQLTNQTNVTATASGAGAIILSNSDGSDIVLDDNATAALGGDETFHAGIVLASDVSTTSFSVSGTFAVQTGGTALGASQANETLAGVDVLTRANATTGLRALDFALQQVNTLRSELGSVQVRFESTISNLSVTSENLSAARSRIQDADYAKETAELTRTQILQQAGISILAQANAVPSNVLALLQ